MYLTLYRINNELFVWLFTEKGCLSWSEHSLFAGIFCLRVGPFETSSMSYCTRKGIQITPYSTKLIYPSMLLYLIKVSTTFIHLEKILGFKYADI